MITFKNKGKWSKTFKFLDMILERKYVKILDKYGQLGVEALASATPIDTGKTATSWEYEITNETNSNGGKTYSIVWYNTNTVNAGRNIINIAILIQYGHAARDGSYVMGTDYINPALKVIFDKLADAAWEEVTGA